MKARDCQRRADTYLSEVTEHRRERMTGEDVCSALIASEMSRRDASPQQE